MKQLKIALITISLVTLLFDAAESAGKFVPSTNTIIADLKKSLESAQATIVLLTKSNSNEKVKWLEMISVLQNNVTTLTRELDDGQLQYNQKLNDLEQKVQNLTAWINYLSVQILPYDFIRDLEDENFEEALKKLHVLRQNETLVTDLISKVHGNQMDKKIPLINRFGRSIPTVRLTLLVYASLANATTVPSTATATSVGNIVDLVKSVESEVIDQSSATYETKNEAKEVKNKLLNVIKQMTASILKSAMVSGTSSSDVLAVSDLMNSIDSEIFFEIITNVVNSVYFSMNTKKMLEHIDGYARMSYLMDGLTAAFYKMNSEDANGDDMIDLTFRIQAIKKQPNYDKVSSTFRNRFEELKDDMPSSLSALAFAPSVCLKNVRYREYLYAASILEGSHRRRVFTWGRGTEVCEGSWQISRYSTNEISIKNRNFQDYLFYSSIYPGQYNMVHRSFRAFKMFTWTPNENIIQNKWQFVYSTASDNVQILNTNEAGLSLVACEDFYNDNRRYVDAAAEYNWKRDNNLWTIEDCDYRCK